MDFLDLLYTRGSSKHEPHLRPHLLALVPALRRLMFQLLRPRQVHRLGRKRLLPEQANQLHQLVPVLFSDSPLRVDRPAEGSSKSLLS